MLSWFPQANGNSCNTLECLMVVRNILSNECHYNFCSVDCWSDGILVAIMKAICSLYRGVSESYWIAKKYNNPPVFVTRNGIWDYGVLNDRDKVDNYTVSGCIILFKEVTSFKQVKKFHAFYGTRIFITAHTSPHHPSLSWISSIRSIILQSTSWRFILIWSSYLCLGLPSIFSPSDFPSKTLHPPHLSLICTIYPSHFIPLNFITRKILGEQYASFSS